MGDKRSKAKKHIAQLHQILGRAHLILNHSQQAQEHFSRVVNIGNAMGKQGVGSIALRAAADMGLLPQAAQLFKQEMQAIQKQSLNEKALARIQVLETELELLQHELNIAQQRRQIYRPSGATDTSPLPDSKNPEWLDWLKTRAMSQLGQDLWVLERTKYKRSGFFVEFGATDGVLLSNTWLLEKEFGWNGILAEPNPKFFEKLQANRGCQVSDACIGARTGDVVEFVFAAEYGGVKNDLLEGPHTRKTLGYASQEEHCAQLTTISLHDFLILMHAPQDIDYISIDTEGSEFEILQTFPFDFWNVSLFTIEHNYTEQREKIAALMVKNGFSKIEKQWDDWWIKSPSTIIKHQ